MKNLTVLKVNVGEELEVVTIPNTLEGLQSIVGGYIQTVMIAEDILLVCDEEGLLKDYPHNFTIASVEREGVRLHHHIHGNIFFVSTLGEDFYSLDKLQIQRVKNMFRGGRTVCIASVFSG